jgi:Cu(I)/Ag(I) efflux system membrane protein CusA/SilA
MKPLATPVLGGMESSLILVVIVTPMFFSWLRERELREPSGAPVAARTGPSPVAE